MRWLKKIMGWGAWTHPQDTTSVATGPTSVHAKFVWDQPREHSIAKVTNGPQANHKRTDDFSIEQDGIDTTLSPQLKHLFNQRNAINSTAIEDIDPETQQPTFIVPRPTSPRTSLGGLEGYLRVD
jgi:Ca2+-transporting ATPase